MRLTSLVPSWVGLCVRRLVVENGEVILTASAIRRTAPCPLCRCRSARIHSSSGRSLVDLPLGERPVRLRLTVRRFRCLNPGCSRRIFAERFPKLAPAYSRRTHAQRRALVDFGLETGGAAGARLANRRGVIGSRATLLRLLHALPASPVETPRILGVDDWARKRGQTYGTILIDLERHRPVDLLEDRTADGFAAWLKAHPGVEVIARDRGGAYADGARQGAPQAVQVADRFHLLMNVGETLERVLGRKRALLREAARVVDAAAVPPPLYPNANPETTIPPATDRPPSRDEQRKSLHRAQRQERDAAVVALHEQGFNLSHIAREVGIGRKTVRRFLRAGSFPERAPSPRRPSILDPFEPFLRQRWAEGCHNSLQLWREIHAQDFAGAASLVRRLVGDWRPAAGRSGRPVCRDRLDDATLPPPATRSLSPRQARWLLLRSPDQLRPEEMLYRDHVLCADDEVRLAHALADEFGQMVRWRKREDLDPWLTRATESPLPEFREFARVMRRDQPAVEAALTLEWSNGQTEGQITRLKFVKRQMYGRAGFRLLKKRVLRAA